MSLYKEYKPLIYVLAIILCILLVFLTVKYEINLTYLLTSLWIVFLVFLLWMGNRIISNYLNKVFPWSKYMSLRFFVQLISVLIYSLICINLSYLLFKFLFTTDPPTPGQITIVNAYSSLIVLPLFSIYYVIHFINEWKKSQLKSEMLEKESIRSQLDNLKNHLDPHFLFNNLNILSSLIDQDTEQSKKYLNRFAEVYRFMLKTNSSELIPLRQEIEFLDAYFHLVFTRFQEALFLKIDIPEQIMVKNIPPLTLQMLIENAIKHNSFNRKHPLQLNIQYRNDNYLIVSNTIQNKNSPEVSIGSGLKNIKERYRYFTDNKVNIFTSDNVFVVEVPLIELEEA